MTATLISLNWRTRHRPIRAEHAAIARLRFEPFTAALAVIEKLAGVRGHCLGRLMTAMLTGQYVVVRARPLGPN
jgi:hypothetical protein